MDIKPYTPLSDKYKPLVENRIKKVLGSPYRPLFHIAPPCGLLNDPNGLCYLDGNYHVFYQWYPFEAKHDMKHWNHVSSKDLVHWKEEEDILIPDLPYEKNGCYSGNAYVNSEDNKAYLFYTANYKDDKIVRIPQQALAVMDSNGKITKSTKNPLIKSAPNTISVNIRDPFVFEFQEKLYMLLGAETKDHKGCVLLYRSENLEDWDYCGILKILLDGKEVDLGEMVECPGFIQAEEDILFLSTIHSHSDEYKHENRFDSIVLIGSFKPDDLLFEARTLQEVDDGFDFYAPQPFYGKDKEPLYYGWFGSANESLPEDKYHWRHALTLPRLIKLENGKLKTPVYPLLKEQFKKVNINETFQEIFESSKEPVLLNWELDNDQSEHHLRVGTEGDYWELIVDFPKNQIRIDRSNLLIPVDPDYGMIRSIDINNMDKIKLELFLDNSFNELYLNDGERVLSFRSYEKTLE